MKWKAYEPLVCFVEIHEISERKMNANVENNRENFFEKISHNQIKPPKLSITYE